MKIYTVFLAIFQFIVISDAFVANTVLSPATIPQPQSNFGQETPEVPTGAEDPNVIPPEAPVAPIDSIPAEIPLPVQEIEQIPPEPSPPQTVVEPEPIPAVPTTVSTDISTSGGEEAYIKVLETIAATLEPKFFREDLILRQKLDDTHSITRYTGPDDRTVFERHGLDTEKDVVILSSSEDQRKVNDLNKKRTFVLLRRVPPQHDIPTELNNVLFYLTYAYIRDARPTDEEKDIIPINGRKITVEWDGYEHRPAIATFNTGWSNCGYTVLFSCQMNWTAVERAVDYDTLQAITDQVARYSEPSTTTTAVAAAKTIERLESDPSFDSEEYQDLYGDFDLVPRSVLRKQVGRGFFQSITSGISSGFNSFSSSFQTGMCKGMSMFNGGGNCGGMMPPPLFLNQPQPQQQQKQEQKDPEEGGSEEQDQEGCDANDPYCDQNGMGAFSHPAQQQFGFGALPGFIPSLFGGGSAPQIVIDRSKFSNAESSFGTFYAGVQNSAPIFIPDGFQIPVMFVPDGKNQLPVPPHGLYVPGTSGYPDSFVPDNFMQIVNVIGMKGTMIPDAMIQASTDGGIHGILTGESFRPDTLGTQMWFNPEREEYKKVWSPIKKKDSKPARPKTTPEGQLITYGVYFPGVSGSPDIFIPEGEAIPGYFVPNDPAKPDVVAIPHGTLIATMPAGHGTFYAETTKELANVQQVRGAFMPDTMNLTGAIGGLITKDLANSYVFVVDVPGQEFAYFKGKPEAQGMWTPFLKPGEWTPPTTTTPKPVVVSVTTPAPAIAAAKKKIANPAFMFGIKFPGQSDMDIFIPDNLPVEGQMFPEDSNIPPIEGRMIVSKLPDSPYIFQANPDIVATLPEVVYAMFIPNGISGGNGIMGELKPDETKQNCTFNSDPPGKGYWYIKNKTENANVWTPFLPPVEQPPTKKPTIIDKIQTMPFLNGFYVPGIPGKDPVFIPEDGVVGCFVPDTDTPPSCGTYYPEKMGDPSPPEFVQDIPNSLPGNTPGSFIPQLKNGSDAEESFHATFVQGNPSTLILDKPAYQGWSQTYVKVSTVSRTTVTTSMTNNTIEERQSNTPIEVGGGFVGFPTNSKGLDAMVNPNNPIFKEFVHWKSKEDKSIAENDKIVITNNNQGQADLQAVAQSGSVRTSFVSLQEFRSYVEERYTIKMTKIKTDAMDEMIELAVPKAAEKYIKKKKRGPIKINLNINAMSNAGAGAGAGAGGSIGSGNGAAGVGSSGVSGTGLPMGGKCGGKWSTSASATAIAHNGSNANSDAHAINGGDAKSTSLAKDGANAQSNANVVHGGQANAMTMSKNRSNGSSLSNAFEGGVANSLSKTSKDGGVGQSEANAKKTGPQSNDGCAGGGLPEEIEVDSHAAAEALNNGTGTGGNIVNSYANTNVKIDMGSLIAKIAEMSRKRDEEGGDDEDSPPFEINVNTNSQAGAGANSAKKGRGFKKRKGRMFKGRSFPGQGRGRSMGMDTVKPGSGLQSRAGWKTEYKVIEPNCTLVHEEEIFYGLGSCPRTVEPDSTWVLSADPEKLIDFYLRVLRVDCLEKVQVRVKSLFSKGFLTLAMDEHTKGPGHYFQVPQDNLIKSKPKLSDDDLRKLSSAFELSVFSQIYFYHTKKRDDNAVVVVPFADEDGLPSASRSVRFFTEFALNFVQSARSFSPQHYVRLTRNMLTTIRTLLIKLHQDNEGLSHCKGCTVDVVLNHRDRTRAIALLEFFIHGLVPFDLGQLSDIRIAFTNFLQLNNAKFEDRVEEFQAQFKLLPKANSQRIKRLGGEPKVNKNVQKPVQKTNKPIKTTHKKPIRITKTHSKKIGQKSRNRVNKSKYRRKNGKKSRKHLNSLRDD